MEIPTRATGTATARMLDRLGNPNQVPVTVTERDDPANQFRWIVAEAALAPLAPGDYAIETMLGDVKQVTAFQFSALVRADGEGDGPRLDRRAVERLYAIQQFQLHGAECLERLREA